MTLNTLIIGTKEQDAFKDLASKSRDLQGVVLYTIESQGHSSVDRVFGIVVSGHGEPFSDSNYDTTIDDRLDELYADRPEISGLDFHVHSASSCATDQSLARGFSVADEIQLAVNARHPDYRILFGSSIGLSLSHISSSASGVSYLPAPLEPTIGSGVRANIDIDSVHDAYVPILEGFGLTMYRVAAAAPAASSPTPINRPAAPAAPAPAVPAPLDPAPAPAMAAPAAPASGLDPQPLHEHMIRYFISGGFFSFAHMFNSFSEKMYGMRKDTLETVAYSLAAIGLGLGIHTVYNHLRHGSK